MFVSAGTNPKSLNIEYHSPVAHDGTASTKGVLLDIMYTNPSKLSVEICNIAGNECERGDERLLTTKETAVMLDRFETGKSF